MDDKNIFWDASASWNGYSYQGKVALLAVLDKICSLKCIDEFQDELHKYSLELEWIEDFALVYNDNYDTIHQVKNKDKYNMKDYSEALSNLAEKLSINPDIKVAYLHSKNDINVTNWNEELTNILKEYIPFEVDILNNIEPKNLMILLQELFKDDKKKFDMRTSNINKQIINEFIKKNLITNKTDITEILVSESVSKLIENKKSVLGYLTNDAVIKKIKRYKYLDDEQFGDSANIVSMIYQAIKIYWGDEITELRKERIEIYYFHLISLLIDHITKRHEGTSITKRIEFHEFITILDNSELVMDTKEQQIKNMKDLLEVEREMFCSKRCKVKSDSNCNQCMLEEISGEILKLPLNKAEKVFRIMALHINGDLRKTSTELINKSSLNRTFFGGLSEINNMCEFNDLRILYELQNKYMLVTTIFSDNYMDNEVITGLVENPIINEICMRILDNRKADTCLMEIDKLLTADMDVEDIIKAACKINEIDETEVKYPSFMKVTNCKQVSLISLSKAKIEYGERVK